VIAAELHAAGCRNAFEFGRKVGIETFIIETGEGNQSPQHLGGRMMGAE